MHNANIIKSTSRVVLPKDESEVKQYARNIQGHWLLCPINFGSHTKTEIGTVNTPPHQGYPELKKIVEKRQNL